MKFRSLDNARYFRDSEGDVWRENENAEFQLVESRGEHVTGRRFYTREQIEADYGPLTEEDNR